MGPIAFAYYFPVLETYLKTASVAEDDFDPVEHAAIAHCIEFQFDDRDLSSPWHLSARVLELAEYVLTNIRNFGFEGSERTEVSNAWRQLADKVRDATS